MLSRTSEVAKTYSLSPPLSLQITRVINFSFQDSVVIKLECNGQEDTEANDPAHQQFVTLLSYLLSYCHICKVLYHISKGHNACFSSLRVYHIIFFHELMKIIENGNVINIKDQLI